ncbi:MAG: serine hydrolase [Chloroflexota bacterium]|nr:serine hydrolase [Chloroflexota bacterium]
MRPWIKLLGLALALAASLILLGSAFTRPSPPSLSTTITGGEVTADTKLGALLPLAGAPVADVTLVELASHRSGLSAQGMQLDETIPFLVRLQMHRNPFIHDVDGVLAIARKATLSNRGDFVYSNLGTALLGLALAAAAHPASLSRQPADSVLPAGGRLRIRGFGT